MIIVFESSAMGNSHIGAAPRSLMNGRVLHYYTPSAWVDGRAEAQLSGCLDLPGVSAVAGYPDLHPGRNGPVGAAILADRLHPLLVGSDIGCGMALFALDLPARKFSADKAARRLRVLEEPFHNGAAVLGALGLPPEMVAGLGSIGGGNHFCEVQRVDDLPFGPVAGLENASLCLLVHSGSRAWGEAAFRRHESPAGIIADSDAGRAYLADHDRAVLWAQANRHTIAQRAAEALRCEAVSITDVPHNLVALTPHGWLHRKGAAVAKGGLVPLAGSRDSHSHLLRVTGAVDTPFQSLAHGAGRKHDRAAMHGRLAKNRSTLAGLRRNAFGGQVVCENPDLLIEEAGSAYKPIAGVLADLQTLGLAEAVARLKPLLTYKKAVEGRE